MNLLDQYGWNHFHPVSHIPAELEPARVLSIRGFKYLLITMTGEKEAELSGKLLFTSSQEELPKVGDWVAFANYETLGYIVEVLPRVNALSRKNPGNRTERQVMAANIDAALIVQGLDRDFNIMRLDRYIVQISACGIRPIVLLNKSDLVEDRGSFEEAIARLGRNVTVHFCSTFTRAGIDVLRNEILHAGKTYMMIGSSGVGKSSLLNVLLEGMQQPTGEVSESTSKGKHTTTTRDLFLLQTGSLLLDTPGMREFGITHEEEAMSFPSIEAHAGKCRFNDCLHIDEVGCAVLAALENGELDPVAYDSYVKLMKEQRRFEIKAEDKKRMGKVVGRMVREANAHRKKFKY